VKHALAVLLLGWVGAAWGGGEAVNIPGLGVSLDGRLYVPDGKGRFPAIVMLHGCSGLWDKSGEPTASFRFWAEHFRARGYVTLLLDSFGPRGETEICTQMTRKVSEVTDRPRDAHAALRWLASRSDVDRARIHVMGWSNGAMAALHALRPDAPGHEPEGPRFRSGIAFYPGCAAFAKTGFRPVAPLLIQSGGADDWTPARNCELLAKRTPGWVEIDVYPGALHGFDRVSQPVRERPEVRNPNRPGGRGATVGTHAQARERSILRVTEWLARQAD
jgi:dienelactone hydrolase